jgi:hypothetical protein
MRILLLIITSLFAINANAGHGVRNGGATIYCNGSGRSYSLDYFLARDSFDRNLKILNFNKSKDSLSRIFELLKLKAPKLAQSFQAYLAYIDNTSNPTAPYFWKAAGEGLPEIDDQKITNGFSICQGSRFGGTPFTATQAIIRHDISTEIKKQIIFEYNAKALEDLSGTQKSFLYVHEWLWDISDDVELNRKINYFFHSELLDQMSTLQVTQQLQKFGLR